MTEPDVPNGQNETEEDAEMSALLRGAMKDVGEPSGDMVKRVQRTIRKRSKGRFFSDGWSTTQRHVNYLVIAVTMLLVAGLAYFALHPSGFQ